MPNSELVALLHDAWDDIDRAHSDLEEQSAMQRFRGGSAFGWTYAHIAKQLDLTVNVRAQGLDPDPIVGQDAFDFGGTGESPGWANIRNAALVVREKARTFLDPLSDEQLRSIEIPSRSRGRGVSLEYSLCRVVTHNWFHTGEVATKRDMDGHRTGEYPGRLGNFLSSTVRALVQPPDSILVRLLHDAWEDSDRVYSGLGDTDATAPHFDGSPFGWTLAHFTGQMNMFASVLLGRGEQPAIFEHPTMNQHVEMSVDDWKEVQRVVAEVRQDASDLLRGLSPEELATTTVPATSRTPEVHLRYMLGRLIAHAYFHIGEVAAKRDMLGHDVGDYPGRLSHSLGR